MKNNFLKLSENFFFNGYLIGKINNDEIVRKLNEISEKFYENKIENNNYYFENQMKISLILSLIPGLTTMFF